MHTHDGGEPHCKCAAFRFRKGVSRESLKDIFAAAPCWCGTIQRSFNPSARTCLHPKGVASFPTPYLPQFPAPTSDRAEDAECNAPPSGSRSHANRC
jgi:hypothetical protein